MLKFRLAIFYPCWCQNNVLANKSKSEGFVYFPQMDFKSSENFHLGNLKWVVKNLDKIIWISDTYNFWQKKKNHVHLMMGKFPNTHFHASFVV